MKGSPNCRIIGRTQMLKIRLSWAAARPAEKQAGTTHAYPNRAAWVAGSREQGIRFLSFQEIYALESGLRRSILITQINLEV